MREGVEEREPPPLHVQLQGGRGAGRRDSTKEERTDGRTDAAIPGDSLQGVLENEGGEEEEEEEEDGEGVVVGDGREGGGRVEVDA